jgi:hypothetical protein
MGVLWVLASAVKDIRIVGGAGGAGNYYFRFGLLIWKANYLNYCNCELQ